jgi:hypothetical protein
MTATLISLSRRSGKIWEISVVLPDFFVPHTAMTGGAKH